MSNYNKGDNMKLYPELQDIFDTLKADGYEVKTEQEHCFYVNVPDTKYDAFTGYAYDNALNTEVYNHYGTGTKILIYV